MNKADTAAYLVSLSALLKDQDASGVNNRSQLIASEFDREWERLKTLIQKEHDDEARKREELIRAKDQSRPTSSVSGRGVPDGFGVPGGYDPTLRGSGLSSAGGETD